MNSSKGTCCPKCETHDNPIYSENCVVRKIGCCHQSVEKKDAHECYNGCWEHHCPTCGKFGHYKTCEKDTPAPDWRNEFASLKTFTKTYPDRYEIYYLIDEDFIASRVESAAVERTKRKIIEVIEKYQANAGTHVTKDCKTIYSGCTECSKVQMASDILAVIRAKLPQEK